MKRIACLLVFTVSLLLTTIAGVAQAPKSTGPREIRHVEHPIPGQYIVVFRDDLVRGEDVESVTAELSRRHQGVVRSTWRHALRGFAARMDAAHAQALAQDPRVADVQEDGDGYAASVTQANVGWNLDEIDSRSATRDGNYTYNERGTGVNVYVIDTGIRTNHPEFEGRASGAYTILPDPNATDDCNGHGTHVAGLIGGRTYGVAKGVNLFAVRVTDCFGHFSVSDLLAGVNFVTGNFRSPAVANVSLGVNHANDPGGWVDSAIRSSIASGVTYVVAAGNGTANDSSPVDACTQPIARVSEAITVGATAWSAVIPGFAAHYSNYGPCVDLLAPGGDPFFSPIASAGINAGSYTTYMSGTSMAAPHVAGVAALYLAGHPNADPNQVSTALTSNATPNVITGVDGRQPNLFLYEPFAAAVHVGDVNGDFIPDILALNDGYALIQSNVTNGLALKTGGYSPCNSNRTTLMADVNGDRRADIVCINSNNIIVSLSTGAGFSIPKLWISAPVSGNRGTVMADVNGDGRADVVAFNDFGNYVSLSTGTTFAPPTLWGGGFWGTHGTFVADVNGDGRADVVAIDDFFVLVAFSTGAGFQSPILGLFNSSVYGDRATTVADMNGDGRADLVGINSWGTWVALSTGTGFALPELWGPFSIYGSVDTFVADLNGDGYPDIVAVDANAGVWAAFNWGGGFARGGFLPPQPWFSKAIFGMR